MSERADPWEGVPAKWRNAVAMYGLYMDEQSRDRLAALLREAAADQARVNWLQEEVGWSETRVEGVSEISVDVPYRETLRDAIDAARGSVPSPTPTKE